MPAESNDRNQRIASCKSSELVPLSGCVGWIWNVNTKIVLILSQIVIDGIPSKFDRLGPIQEVFTPPA